jgi:hypothetical protein
MFFIIKNLNMRKWIYNIVIKMKPILKGIGGFIVICVLLSLLHWLLVNIYISICAPLTLFGPIQTLISLGSPVCHFINHVQFNISSYYITLWVSAATGCCLWITNQFNVNRHED